MMDKNREKFDRVWRLLLADAKGDTEMSGKVLMEIFTAPDPAEAFFEFTAVLSAFTLKGLDAQNGGRTGAIEFIEGAIANGLDPDLN